MSPVELKYGEVVFYKGRKVVITSVIDLSRVEVTDTDTGESFEVSVAEIEKLPEQPTKPLHPLDPESPESEYWDVARKRLEIIKPLLTPNRTKREVERRAKEFNLNPATLYR